MTRRDVEKEMRKLDGQMRDDQFDTFDILDKHLMSCGNDLTLLTLTGHLVLENALDTILARVLRIPCLPKEKGARLTFFQKLSLVKTFAIENFQPGPDVGLFAVVAKLNTARNHLAHYLKRPDEIQKEIKELLNCYYTSARKKRVQATDLSQPLRSCLQQLWKFLFKVRHHLFETEKERLGQRGAQTK